MSHGAETPRPPWVPRRCFAQSAALAAYSSQPPEAWSLWPENGGEGFSVRTRSTFGTLCGICAAANSDARAARGLQRALVTP